MLHPLAGHVLLAQPRWRPEDLGQPLPPSAHATSVCLPTWADVIDYERAEPRVLRRLQTGYPRFFVHPWNERLFAECQQRFAGPDECCQVYPTRAAAQRCLDSLRRWTGLHGRLVPWSDSGPFVICLPQPAARAARKHWRHSGEGFGSRQAQALLEGQPPIESPESKREVRKQIAELTGLPADHVYLFASGMSAIYGIHRAIQRLFPGRKTVQFGFPYVDTLKLQQDLGCGAHFFPCPGPEAVRELETRMRTEPPAAIYCEFPSNPLLVSPDLEALAASARREGIPLVVDETLGSYVNLDLRPVADVLITSLTKYFSGAGDVLAGAAIINPAGALADRLLAALESEYEDNLGGAEARLLADYGADFPARMKRINRTAEQLCDFCSAHPAVETVYYPPYSGPETYRAFQRPGGGWGGLFSLLLKDAPRRAPRFYDALEISKGPNLGTIFSLACPFTLLAHYEELDWAADCGVSPHLVRISVGLEEPEDLQDRLDRALEK